VVITYKDGEKWHKRAIEFKSQWGRGADFTYSKKQPKTSHMKQLGLYLKDFYDKGQAPDSASLVYMFISSDPAINGVLYEFMCKYDPDEGTVRCYQLNTPNGAEPRNITVSVKSVIQQWENVVKHVEKKETPKPDYVYKHPLTPEYLEELSDYNILAALEGRKILGDWQPLYSKYKDKILQVDGITQEYTSSEKELLRAEYKKRHPRSKK